MQKDTDSNKEHPTQTHIGVGKRGTKKMNRSKEYYLRTFEITDWSATQSELCWLVDDAIQTYTFIFGLSSFYHYR